MISMKYFLTGGLLVVSIGFSSRAVAKDGEGYIIILLNTKAIFDTTDFIEVQPETAISMETREEAWKQWQIVENFTYGKDRGNLPMIADLNSLHPYFRDRITELVDVCKKQGIELAVVESYRTHAK